MRSPSSSDGHDLHRAAEEVAIRLADTRANDMALPPPHLLTKGSLITTGIGLSGGVARLMAAQSGRIGRPARFASLTEIERTQPITDTLVVFSQSYSGNARLSQHARAQHSVLFTGTTTSVPSWFSHRVPTLVSEHHSSLVRLQSPVVSLYGALRWFALAFPQVPWRSEIDRVPELAQKAWESNTPADVDSLLSGPVVFLTASYEPAELYQLACKWSETIFQGPPGVFNVLELAHGPLQALYDRPATFIGLEHPPETSLWHRVQSVLHPDRHRYLSIPASLPPPLSFWEFDGAINALLLRLLAQRPELLNHHPTKHIDTPLYRYGQ